MSNPSQRLMFVALIWANLVPAQAAAAKHPPKHPPLPPARPVFPDDEILARDAAGTAPDSVQPQAQSPVARLDDAREVAERPPAAAAPTARAYLEQEQVPGFVLAEQAGLAELTRKYARKHGVPLALLHRIIMRESRYHPHLVNRSYYGLMQITPATARSMGYHGAPSGLLDPETNLAFASPYLANAWALAGGDMDRAVRLYASGYYYTAKSKGMLGLMRNAESPPVKAEAVAAAPPPPPRPANIFENIFGGAPQ
ncbi:transglycosylase SLT domain-containing protein [uncultured Rhodoblastus sp.]|uniref:transglycosylase SLT domain-containing protein n=1 Tax=uncultured Rhodoblastus sp. TaxID=543037 RepID=UPI0025E16674|nr:transglycosylase SLT domain-containing protein [uncultured Rhodoblastus sp.]